MRAYFFYVILFLNFCILQACKTPKGGDDSSPNTPASEPNPNPTQPEHKPNTPGKPSKPNSPPQTPERQSVKLEIRYTYPEHRSTISDRRPSIAVAFTEDFQFHAEDPKFFVLDHSSRRLGGVYEKRESMDKHKVKLYILQFSPDHDLELGAIYTVNVSGEIQALNGAKLGADHEWTFSTAKGSVPAAAPSSDKLTGSTAVPGSVKVKHGPVGDIEGPTAPASAREIISSVPGPTGSDPVPPPLPPPRPVSAREIISSVPRPEGSGTVPPSPPPPRPVPVREAIAPAPRAPSSGVNITGPGPVPPPPPPPHPVSGRETIVPASRAHSSPRNVTETTRAVPSAEHPPVLAPELESNPRDHNETHELIMPPPSLFYSGTRPFPFEAPVVAEATPIGEPVLTAFQKPTITARKDEDDSKVLVVTISFHAPIVCKADLRNNYFTLKDQKVIAEFECDGNEIKASYTFTKGAPAAHTEYTLLANLDIEPKEQPLTNGIIEKSTIFTFRTGDL